DFFARPDGTAVVGTARTRRDAAAVAPFVGREAEFVATLSAYDRSVEDKTPILVSVSGPPGIGKSRLAREFVARGASRPDCPRVAQVRCAAYGRAQALGVAADALRTLLGLSKGASLSEAEHAVRSRHLVHDDSQLLAPLLANQPFPEGIDPRGA